MNRKYSNSNNGYIIQNKKERTDSDIISESKEERLADIKRISKFKIYTIKQKIDIIEKFIKEIKSLLTENNRRYTMNKNNGIYIRKKNELHKQLQKEVELKQNFLQVEKPNKFSVKRTFEYKDAMIKQRADEIARLAREIKQLINNGGV